MGRVQGRVALITGAARGQGRSHAIRLAQEGADIIAIDLCDQIGTVHYDMPTAADLAETRELIEGAGRRVIAAEADVRDTAALHAVVEQGIRVNSVNPTGVSTPMLINEPTFKLFLPDSANRTVDEFAAASQNSHVQPVPWVDSEDVSNAVLFLASDESRYMTGVALPVDAGLLINR